MKIFKIINALTLGGAQFVALDLARRAREDGHEVEIACFRDGPLGEVLRNEGFKVHLLGEKMLGPAGLCSHFAAAACFQTGYRAFTPVQGQLLGPYCLHIFQVSQACNFGTWLRNKDFSSC